MLHVTGSLKDWAKYSTVVERAGRISERAWNAHRKANNKAMALQTFESALLTCLHVAPSLTLDPQCRKGSLLAMRRRDRSFSGDSERLICIVTCVYVTQRQAQLCCSALSLSVCEQYYRLESAKFAQACIQTCTID